MMKIKTVLVPVVVFFVLAVSCKNENSTEPENVNDVRLFEHLDYGKIIVDKAGRALYFYTVDAGGESLCEDGCLDVWPVFYAENFKVDNGLNSTDFSVITRRDNSKQLAFKGWPLYYYFADIAEGIVTCDGVDDVWFVAKPDYTIMIANAQLVGADGNNYNSNYQLGDEIVQYFTDREGNTLYTFTNDMANKNNYTSSDFSNNSVWPIFEEDLANVPSILDKSLFSSTDVFGKIQITYKGWPLYYYGADGSRGDTKGVSVPTPGVWPVAVQTMTAAPN